MIPKAVAFPNGTVCVVQAAQVTTYIPGCPPVLGGRLDLVEAWLADRLGLPFPPSLYGRSTQVENDPALARAERQAALAVQEFAALAGLDPFR